MVLQAVIFLFSLPRFCICSLLVHNHHWADNATQSRLSCGLRIGLNLYPFLSFPIKWSRYSRFFFHWMPTICLPSTSNRNRGLQSQRTLPRIWFRVWWQTSFEQHIVHRQTGYLSTVIVTFRFRLRLLTSNCRGMQFYCLTKTLSLSLSTIRMCIVIDILRQI